MSERHPDGPDYQADDPMSLMELAKAIHENADKHGFWPKERGLALKAVAILRGQVTSPTINRALDTIERYVRKQEDRNYGEMIALIHSEASEALEAHRSKEPAYHLVSQPYGPDKPEGELVELADVIIRCLDTMYGRITREGYSGPNIDQIVIGKHQFNESRPYKHGREY